MMHDLDKFKDANEDQYPEDQATLRNLKAKQKAVANLLQNNKNNLDDHNIQHLFNGIYGFGLCAINQEQTPEKYE